MAIVAGRSTLISQGKSTEIWCSFPPRTQTVCPSFDWSCVCDLSRFSCIWFFVTPWTVALQAPLSMGFPRQEYWSGLPCPPPGDLPDPGIKPMSLMPPALAGRFFSTGATWEALTCTLYRKAAVIHTVLSWMLWIVSANCQTWGGCRNSVELVSLVRSVSGFTILKFLATVWSEVIFVRELWETLGSRAPGHQYEWAGDHGTCSIWSEASPID